MSELVSGSSAPPVLEVAGLHVGTADLRLVSDVSFTLSAGERVGLIGESGSGKSLTALALMGLLPEGVRATGSVRLAGVDHDLVGAPEPRLAAVRGAAMTMVFQEPMTALNPSMRVGDQVAEVMLLHGRQPDRRSARAAAVELLDSVHLPEPDRLARAYPHQLSGGQRQRVMIAIALANGPSVLLADEPTTALDVTVQAQVLDLILAGVAARDAALLFITHDLAVVATVCERVMVMYGGRIVEAGPVTEVFTRPRHPYTQGLLAASDLADTGGDGRLRTIPGSVPAAGRFPGGCVFRTRCPNADDDCTVLPGWTVRDGGGYACHHPVRSPEVQESHIQARQSPERGFPELPEPARASPLIAVRDLHRTYRRPRTSLRQAPPPVHALRGVSFDIAAGQRFGLVGESGSGKSTLIRLLAGLDSPTSGTIRFDGRDVGGQPERRLRFLREQLQVVFQDPMGSLDPRMRVRDIVAEPLAGRREPDVRGRVAELLAAVGLPPDAGDRYPHQFSGGQRQRISIARALAPRPSVLVADEPVSALDVSVRAQILNLLADLVERFRLTLVFVSHDLSVVRHVCDTTAVLHRGELVELGPSAQVAEAPQHPYTRRLVAAVPTIRGALAGRTTADLLAGSAIDPADPARGVPEELV
jgi:oligopeptide/dipeptide ABC transporter ATP-binding protein